MGASFHGHVDIMRMLIEAKAQVNTQEEVCCFYHQKIYCTTIVSSIISNLVVLCVSVHREAGLLFTWQLRKEKVMW